jgi:hypothetical protein
MVAEEARPAGRLVLEEIGRTGLTQHGGYIYEEYTRELHGTRWRDTVRDMVDNDPIVGAILFAVGMLLRGVTWTIVPASDDPEDEAVGQFFSECWQDMSHTPEQFLAECLSFLPWGWSLHEIVYKQRLGPNQTDPSKRSQYDDGRIGWRKFAIRSQDTLLKWEIDDADGSVRGMWQQLPTTGKLVFIPIEKSLLFRTTSRKGNPEGRSILRNAVRPWHFRKHIETIEGIGVERDLAGLPVLYAPSQIMLDNASPAEKTLYSQLKRIIRNIKRDEQEGLIIPGDRDDKGNRRYELTLLSTGGQRQFDTNTIVTRYAQQLAMTVLADFVLLGHEKVGSFALSSDKTGMFTFALNTWAAEIAGVLNRYAVPRLMALNGMDPRRRPTFQPGEVQAPDLGALADYVTKLAGSGVPLFPDPELEGYLRRVAKLPTPPLEELEARANELRQLRQEEAERREVEMAVMATRGQGGGPPEGEAPDQGQQAREVALWPGWGEYNRRVGMTRRTAEDDIDVDHEARRQGDGWREAALPVDPRVPAYATGPVSLDTAVAEIIADQRWEAEGRKRAERVQDERARRGEAGAPQTFHLAGQHDQKTHGHGGTGAGGGPAGTPVSKALTHDPLHPPIIATTLAETMAVIDAVHGDGDLPTIPVRLGGNTAGVYNYTVAPDGRKVAREIGVSPGLAMGSPHWALTHEVGHLLDQQGFGGGKGWSSRHDPHPAWQAFRDAVDASPTIQHLRALHTGKAQLPGQGKSLLQQGKYVDYLLKPEEVFARAYTQWIAVKANHKGMLGVINKTTSGPIPMHWPKSEWGPIGAALDALFAAKGWTQ